MRTKSISVSLTSDLLARLDKAAQAEGRTRSQLLRAALHYYWEEKMWHRLTAYTAQVSEVPSEEDVLRLVEKYRTDRP